MGLDTKYVRFSVIAGLLVIPFGCASAADAGAPLEVQGAPLTGVTVIIPKGRERSKSRSENVKGEARDAQPTSAKIISRNAERPRRSAGTDSVPAPRQTSSGAVTGLESARRNADGQQVIGGRVGGQGRLPDTGDRVYTGVVAPGDSPGCIVDEGSATFSSSSRLVMEIGGATPCTEHDQFVVSAALALQGGALQVLLIDGFEPAAGERFDLLDWGTLTGTFGNVDFALAELSPELDWDISKLYITGEVSVVGPARETQVPVPGWMIAGLALVLYWQSTRRSGSGALPGGPGSGVMPRRINSPMPLRDAIQ